MSFGIPATGWVLLFGLAALAVPPLIHLLSRRRYVVVDWGAMQFLKLSQRRRRRILWEDLLLMLLRMALLGVFVLSLASPFLAGQWLAGLAQRPARDIVLVVDRSASMAMELPDAEDTVDRRLKRQLAEFIEGLQPDDRVALVFAGTHPEVVPPGLTRSHRRIAERVEHMPPPSGVCAGPEAVVQAFELLQRHGQNDLREVVVFTDRLRHGWSDRDSLAQWKKVAAWLEMTIDDSLPGTPFPRVWLVGPDDRAKRANIYLRGLRQASRHVWAGKEAAFRVEIVSRKGFSADSLRLALAVDGKHVRYLPVPRAPNRSDGVVAIEFRHRFQKAGSHLLTLRLQPSPGETRNPNSDCLTSDNEQNLAVYVRERLRVLLVDGEERNSDAGSTFHLQRALTGKGPTTARNVMAVAVPYTQFTAELLGGDRGSRPQVLFLADVPSLSDEQIDAIERFVADGGGVCVFLGKRIVDPAFYNERLWRFATGWLPARLLAPSGDVAQPEKAARPDLLSFQHPALDLFLHTENCTLDKARFPRYWRVSTAGTEGATVAATLDNGDPLLIDRRYKRGKVLLCAVPLDGSWGSSFIRIWEYPVFVHEIAYYLADAEPVQCNTDLGEPLRWNPIAMGMEIKPPVTLTIGMPGGKKQLVEAPRLPLTLDLARSPGVFTLRTDGSPPIYHVVRPDWRESELETMSEEEHKAIAERLTLTVDENGRSVEYKAIRFAAAPAGIHSASMNAAARIELWPFLFAFVVALLLFEVWLTRRLARRSGA